MKRYHMVVQGKSLMYERNISTGINHNLSSELQPLAKLTTLACGRLSCGLSHFFTFMMGGSSCEEDEGHLWRG